MPRSVTLRPKLTKVVQSVPIWSVTVLKGPKQPQTVPNDALGLAEGPPLVLPPPLPRQAQHVAVGVELPDVPLLGRGHRVAARARPHLEHGA